MDWDYLIDFSDVIIKEERERQADEAYENSKSEAEVESEDNE